MWTKYEKGMGRPCAAKSDGITKYLVRYLSDGDKISYAIVWYVVWDGLDDWFYNGNEFWCKSFDYILLDEVITLINEKYENDSKGITQKADGGLSVCLWLRRIGGAIYKRVHRLFKSK